MQGLLDGLKRLLKVGRCVNLFAIIFTRNAPPVRIVRSLTISVCTATLFARPYPLRFVPRPFFELAGFPSFRALLSSP